MKQNYYQILGISPETTDKEIRRIYYQLAQKYHPDKARTTEEMKAFEENFALISEAYNVLKDSERRKEYNKSIGLSESTGTVSVVRDQTAGLSANQQTDKMEPSHGSVKSSGVTERAVVARRAFFKAGQYMQSGDFSRAAEFLEVAVKNAPEESKYLSMLAVSLAKSKKGVNRAVELAKKAISLEPYNPEHRLRLGEVYYTIGSISMAKKEFKEVLRWDSTNIEARERLRGMGEEEGSGTKSFFLRLFRKMQKKE